MNREYIHWLNNLILSDNTPLFECQFDEHTSIENVNSRLKEFELNVSKKIEISNKLVQYYESVVSSIDKVKNEMVTIDPNTENYNELQKTLNELELAKKNVEIKSEFYVQKIKLDFENCFNASNKVECKVFNEKRKLEQNEPDVKTLSDSIGSIKRKRTDDIENEENSVIKTEENNSDLNSSIPSLTPKVCPICYKLGKIKQVEKLFCKTCKNNFETYTYKNKLANCRCANEGTRRIEFCPKKRFFLINLFKNELEKNEELLKDVIIPNCDDM